jgi:hypothetical protein
MSAGNDGARGDARKRRIPQPDPDGGIALTDAEWAEYMGGVKGEAVGVELTEAEREALFTAGDHHPDHCDCSAYVIEQAFAEDDCCGGLLDTIAATESIVAEWLRQVEAAVLRAHVAGDYWVNKCKKAEAALAEARQVHRDLTSRLGFGDGITEPQASNDQIVQEIERERSEASDLHEYRYACPPDCPENTPERDYGEHCTAHNTWAQLAEARQREERVLALVKKWRAGRYRFDGIGYTPAAMLTKALDGPSREGDDA